MLEFVWDMETRTEDVEKDSRGGVVLEFDLEVWDEVVDGRRSSSEGGISLLVRLKC